MKIIQNWKRVGGAPFSQNFNQIKDLGSYPIGYAKPPS